jgi:large subunit ribosomal protein L22
MEARAQARHIARHAEQGSPVVDLIRGKHAARGRTRHACALRRRQASEPVGKVLASAMRRTRTNNIDLDPDDLVVAAQHSSTKARPLKRIRPRAQGRAYRDAQAHQPHHRGRSPTPGSVGRAGEEGAVADGC